MSNNFKSSASKIKFGGFDDLFGTDPVPSTQKIMILPLDKLVDFKDHPFKVVHDAAMDDLIESIKTKGIIEPLVVRAKSDGFYEVIAGHRRKYGAKHAELKEVPCIIVDVTDDEAIIMMVDSNKYREKILPSEKAFSCKMKLEAIKHQGKKTSAQNVEMCNGTTSTQNVEKTLSVDIIGDEHGESRETIRRYIRLTYLIPELLRMVDADKLKFVMAVDISYLTEEMQRWLYEDVMSKYVVKPAQITELRKQLQTHTFDKTEFIKFFEPKTKPISAPKQISTAKISKYFPPHYDKKDIEAALEKLLDTIIVRKMLEELTDYEVPAED